MLQNCKYWCSIASSFLIQFHNKQKLKSGGDGKNFECVTTSAPWRSSLLPAVHLHVTTSLPLFTKLTSFQATLQPWQEYQSLYQDILPYTVSTANYIPNKTQTSNLFIIKASILLYFMLKFEIKHIFWFIEVESEFTD